MSRCVDRRRRAARDFELKLHQIDARNHFRHRMFDLDARVDFHEVEVVALDIVEELDRAGVAVVDRSESRSTAALCRRARVASGIATRRRLLDHLLIAALHRAVALAEMQHAAVAETQHLHFDMARALDVTLEVERAVAEGFLRLGGGALETDGERPCVPRDDHAASAAAGRGLRDDRKADLGREGDRLRGAGQLRAARRHRHAGAPGETASRELVADGLDRRGGGSDEGHAVILAKSRERRALRKEAVARMQRVAARGLRRVHHQVGVEIGGARAAPGRASRPGPLPARRGCCGPRRTPRALSPGRGSWPPARCAGRFRPGWRRGRGGGACQAAGSMRNSA